jgi:hypothetical protein
MHLKEHGILTPPLILPRAMVRLKDIRIESHTFSNQFATGTTVKPL